MFIRSLPSRQEDAHTSSCRRSNYEWIRSTQVQGPCMSSSLPSRPDSIRLAHRAQHATQSHSALVSNLMTLHVLYSLSQSRVSTPWGPLSTSSVSTSRHVVPRTQPICSPSRRGTLHPSSQVEESPPTVTPRLAETRPQGTTCLSKSTGAGPDSPWTSHSITRR